MIVIDKCFNLYDYYLNKFMKWVIYCVVLCGLFEFRLFFCFLRLRLGLFRDAEKQFESALTDQSMVDTYLYVAKVYIRLDQPLAALKIYSQGLERFPDQVPFLLGQARIYEVSDAKCCEHTCVESG